MSPALWVLPLIGLISVIWHPANAMRSEKDFLDKSWVDSLMETVAHMPIQAATTNNVIAQNRSISLNGIDLTDSQNGAYTAEFMPRNVTSRDPDRKLFSVRISDKSTGEKFYVGLPSRDQLRAFQWSHGTAYVFVLDDQVYYVPTPEKQPIRVSSQEDGLLHGTFDWVYNEEIFGRSQVQDGAVWFSSKDKYVAYASRALNSSHEMMITTYTQGYKYDYNYNLEYPKTGEDRLASFSVSIWSVEEQKSKKMEVQLSDKAFHYLFGVSWVTLHGKELLLATWANRWQNETSLTLCSYETGSCSMIYEHKYDKGQWATPEDYAKIVHSNSSVFIILPEPRGDNAWQHVAKMEITADFRFESISFLPSGEYDIKEVVAYRREENLVFYRAQAPQPWNMHVYAASAGARSALNGDKCVTCKFSNCTFQEKPTIISQGDTLNISVWCKGPSEPHLATFSVDKRHQPKGTTITTLPTDGNSTQHEWKIETIRLPNGFEANVKIYEGDSASSVPVTLVVYGGPNSNKVTDEFEAIPKPIGYKHAIVYIDVRGAGQRGWKYRSEIYGKLVTVEVEDTIEAMKMILAKYPRLDKNRVGVYGWSYGGTMTTRLVEMAPESFFKCALAGAPVTNFFSYDATYTERVMADTPRASFTDLTLDVSKFLHTKFMLVHGLRDDNVHFQHSALLIEKLQQENIPFQLMVYPNQAHGCNEESIKPHLQQLMDSFFDACYA